MPSRKKTALFASLVAAGLMSIAVSSEARQGSGGGHRGGGGGYSGGGHGGAGHWSGGGMRGGGGGQSSGMRGRSYGGGTSGKVYGGGTSGKLYAGGTSGKAYGSANRPHFGKHVRHHHHKHRRVFAFAPYYADYGYSDECYWLKSRAIYSGSSYWWNRYYDCINGYY